MRRSRSLAAGCCCRRRLHAAATDADGGALRLLKDYMRRKFRIISIAVRSLRVLSYANRVAIKLAIRIKNSAGNIPTGH